jgi:hypothetical protein
MESKTTDQKLTGSFLAFSQELSEEQKKSVLQKYGVVIGKGAKPKAHTGKDTDKAGHEALQSHTVQVVRVMETEGEAVVDIGFPDVAILNFDIPERDAFYPEDEAIRASIKTFEYIPGTTTIDQILLRRIQKASPRWQHLFEQLREVLVSEDDSDLCELEACVTQLRQKEQDELIKQFKSMSFVSDEPLTRQARLHAKFQNAISSKYQLYTPSDLGIKLGVSKKSARQKINRWINDGLLFTVQDGKDRIPEFEIDWETKRPHQLIKETIKHFPKDTSGWSKAYWMCQQNEMLMGLCPVDVMEESPEDYLYALKASTVRIEN